MRRSVFSLGVTTVLLSIIFFTALRPHLFAIPVSAEASQAPAPKFTAPAGLPDPNDIFQLVNHARANAGLMPLRRDTELAKIAQARADDMATNKYYAHKNPISGQYYYNLLAQAGYKATYSCENLDLEFVTDSETYVTDWANSTHGHKECMLNPDTTEAGYAVAKLNLSTASTDATAYIVVAIHAQP